MSDLKIKSLPSAEPEKRTEERTKTHACDSISRQAAIEAMLELQKEDDDAYGCHIPESFDGERAAEALKALPPEPTEIIRCKDCKYAVHGECELFLKCNEDPVYVKDDDFCSKAERRDE